MTKNRKTERTLKEKLMGSRYQPTKEEMHQDMRLPITPDHPAQVFMKGSTEKQKPA